jgi:hypothetical protein
MPSLTEINRLHDVLKWETDNFYSREQVTVLSGEDLAALAVVGQITNATPTTGTADEGNTGDGVMTGVAAGDDVQLGVYTMTAVEGGGSGAITTPATGTADGGNTGANTMSGVSAGAAVQAGSYTMTCIDATVSGAEIFEVMAPDGAVLQPATVAVAYVNAQLSFTIADPGAKAIVGDFFTVLASAADGDSGLFAVVAPDGSALPDATVAVAYVNDQLNFTIADGATDYVVGDIFTVEVAAGSGKVVEVEAAAVDGSQTAYGFLVDAVDASSGDTAGVAVVRDAIIVATDLAWPAGATAGQKTAWLADLHAAGIIARTEA